MGRIIKNTGRIVPAVVMDARDEAARLLAGAGAVQEESRQRGFAQGYAAGRDAAVAGMTALAAAARADAEAVRQSAKAVALDLARKMAEKIVGRAVELHPDVLGDIVAKAVAASRARDGALTVRVHPDDVAVVQAQRARWQGQVPAGVDVRVAPDASVGRAGCVIETPFGRLDARLESQLDALAKGMRRG